MTSQEAPRAKIGYGWSAALALALWAACADGDRDQAADKAAADRRRIEQLIASGPFDDVTPSEMVINYDGNSISADSIYKGKALRINAMIESVTQDRDGQPLVFLRNRGSAPPARLIICAWGDRAAAGRLLPGRAVMVHGIGAGTIAGTPALAWCQGE